MTGNGERTVDLRLFPLNSVLFPGMRMPLHIYEERYRVMIRECVEEDAPFGVALIKSGPEVGSGAIPHDVGTTARILQVEYLDDGRMNIFTIGEQRFRTLAINTTGQSGHVRSAHYFDQNALWAAGQYRRFPFSRVAVDRGSVGRLLLTP